VILPAGQVEELVADIQNFLGREAEYNRLGQPWHRGYLLWGPPGTGKTSVAKALANHLSLDLWWAPLGDLDKDESLLSIVANVKERSVLLLEDLDTLRAATRRDNESHELSMSALLNALDGVATPHGLITIITSNRPDVLDEAVTRPGRIDRKVEITYVVPEQATRLFELFYQQPPTDVLSVRTDSTTAELLEICKRHPDDPHAAERAIRVAGMVRDHHELPRHGGVDLKERIE